MYCQFTAGDSATVCGACEVFTREKVELQYRELVTRLAAQDGSLLLDSATRLQVFIVLPWISKWAQLIWLKSTPSMITASFLPRTHFAALNSLFKFHHIQINKNFTIKVYARLLHYYRTIYRQKCWRS